ncbi:MAG: DnaT-like ssDNA-binding domain-containing protein [Porticoccaceae bacterium]|nr:DnaT-like ssDNA-binding domain-containing protein [Porticoccaceae bacterium]
MSLIPEKPITISPTLAATIGLEETVLLQLLQECRSHGTPEQNQGFEWFTVASEKLLSLAPFWREDDILRLSAGLHEKGLLLIGGAPFSSQRDFRFAFNDGVATSITQSPQTSSQTSSQPNSQQHSNQRQQPAYNHSATTATPSNGIPTSAKTMGNSWQPSQDAMRQLSQLGVTQLFAQQQIPQFVTYWRERNVPRHSWESKFIKEVWRQWQQAEASSHRRRQEVALTNEWRPSRDALQILIGQGGINSNFVEDSIPEFILYWRDRGDLSSTWDSKFIQHIRRQWQFFSGMMEQDSMPRKIEAQWQPRASVYDVLQMANINRQFAEQLVPEFILYWQENGMPQSSWSTKFLQFVKRQWARHIQPSSTDTAHGKQQGSNPNGRIRDRSFVEDLTDRSWAS